MILSQNQYPPNRPAIMSIATLRTRGGALAVSLPKKVLAMLELQAGSEVEEERRLIPALTRVDGSGRLQTVV